MLAIATAMSCRRESEGTAIDKPYNMDTRSIDRGGIDGGTGRTDGINSCLESDSDELHEITAFSRPRQRRRSSRFRPSYFYDSDSISHLLSIEMLPIVTLLKIFSYVTTKDLLNLCLTSRMFYLPAVVRLYQDVVVVEDLMMLEFVTNIISHLGYHYCTIINMTQFQLLVSVLQNEKLSKHVSSLIIMGNVKQVNWTSIRHLNLKQYVNPTSDMSLSRPNLSNVVSLSFSIKQDNHTDYGFILPNLKTLKVYYENNEINSTKFKKLALALEDAGVFDHLAGLEFEELVVKDLNLLNETNLNLKLAIWINFFLQLQESNVKYNGLRRLVLDGFVNGVEFCDVLDKVFQLNLLTDLKLSVKEFSHLNNSHFDNDHSLLVQLSRRCSNLQNVCISPTFDCLSCQLHLLHEALMELESQLITLNVRFEVTNFDNTKRIYKMIADYQPFLKLLSLYDKAREFSDEKDLMVHLGSEFTTLEKINFYLQLFGRHYPIEISPVTWTTILTKIYGGFYARNQIQLSEYIIEYLDLVEVSISKFPELQRLKINKINLQVNNNQLYFLDETNTPVINNRR